jgi:hypothetical protein
MFVEAGEALIVKTPTPLADYLAGCIEMFRDAGISETLAGQQHDPGPDYVTIG